MGKGAGGKGMQEKIIAVRICLFCSNVCRVCVYQQLLQNLRRNELPVKLINRSLLMRHEYLAGALVELREMVKTSSRANRVLHRTPEACDGVEVMSAVSR